MVVSSAKLHTSASLMKNITLFMKRLNKVDPNVDSYGIPLRIVRYELKVDYIFTR